MAIKLIIYTVFLSVTMCSLVVAEETSVIRLQYRLKKINDFYVRFIQKIVNVDNNVLLEGYGELWVKRPNLFNWHMVSPEENFVISDGRTIWFYIPAIKQVTAYWLHDMSHNVFFMLFSDNDEKKWNNYNVLQQGDFFSIKPVFDNFGFKECKVKITNCGIVESFIIFEENGQHVDYYLLDYNRDRIDLEKFSFIFSEDIQLDEQRE